MFAASGHSHNLSPGERRLAAIMFTDMVGYTALGQRDESLSVALVGEHRKLLRPVFAGHNGREVKTVGDAFLVEFTSVLDAVRCAYDVQRASNEFNKSVPNEKRVHLRVGIHLGDVIETEGDILGDAVNVASRIQSLAEDGGICITQQVYDHVRNKIDLHFSTLGAKELKGVQLPVEAYRVELPWTKSYPTEESGLDKTRIAVLPFANMSPDPNDEYFADGMMEELISAVSKIRNLRVIARTSVMKYKGAGRGIAEISRELKVGSVLEGSVRKAGNRLRMTIQLVDAKNEEHLWSENYDRELGDVFTIQSDVAEKVAEALKVELLSGEKKDIERRMTENTDAYTLYLKGRYYWNERTRDGTDKAVRYFEQAVKMDLKFALAYAGLADCYLIYSDYGWLRPREGNPKAKEYVLKAIEIDPRLAEAHASLGLLDTYYEWRWDEAEKEFKRAIELKPSYATAYHWYSHFLRFMGRSNEAFEQIKRAGTLDPLSRVIGLNLGEDLLLIGKVIEAIEQIEKVIEAYPDYAYVHVYLGFAYYLDSRTDKAINEMRNALELSGGDPLHKANFAYLLGLAGRRDEANKIIEELKELSKTKYVDSGYLAVALFGAGSTDEAFDYLERAHEERANSIPYIRVFPWYREFRKDPRWASLEKRMGLRKE
jgi:TolB-like protein/class 3 adenylate cyclase/Tfp pilus assembly protein PilF